MVCHSVKGSGKPGVIRFPPRISWFTNSVRWWEMKKPTKAILLANLTYTGRPICEPSGVEGTYCPQLWHEGGPEQTVCMLWLLLHEHIILQRKDCRPWGGVCKEEQELKHTTKIYCVQMVLTLPPAKGDIPRRAIYFPYKEGVPLTLHELNTGLIWTRTIKTHFSK